MKVSKFYICLTIFLLLQLVSVSALRDLKKNTTSDNSTSSSSSSSEKLCNWLQKIFTSKKCKELEANSTSNSSSSSSSTSSSSTSKSSSNSASTTFSESDISKLSTNVYKCSAKSDCTYLSSTNSLLLYAYSESQSSTSSSSSYVQTGSSNSDLYCCMHVSFIDKNSSAYDHYYCDFENSNSESLYQAAYLSVGMSSVDAQCSGNSGLMWYIIVFAIVLPVLLTTCITGGVLYYFWTKN